MLCQKCRVRNAQYHSSRIINNQLVDVHFCKRCVENISNHEYTNNIDDILEVLVETDVYDANHADEPRCDTCGTTLAELKKIGLVGCPRCYHFFSDYLPKDTHKPFRKADRAGKRSEFIERLEKRLKLAVESEDFEEAAQLRDKIKNLEKEGLFGDN
jgi:protein arginine kinase activator